jgi:hypothetical protein
MKSGTADNSRARAAISFNIAFALIVASRNDVAILPIQVSQSGS